MSGAWAVKTHLGLRDLGLLEFLFISLCDVSTWSFQHSGCRMVEILTCRLRAHIPREKELGKISIAFYNLGISALFSLLKELSHWSHTIFSGRGIRPYLLMREVQMIWGIFKTKLISEFPIIDVNITKENLVRYTMPVFSGLSKAIFIKVKTLYNIHNVVPNPQYFHFYCLICSIHWSSFYIKTIILKVIWVTLCPLRSRHQNKISCARDLCVNF